MRCGTGFSGATKLGLVLALIDGSNGLHVLKAGQSSATLIVFSKSGKGRLVGCSGAVFQGNTVRELGYFRRKSGRRLRKRVTVHTLYLSYYSICFSIMGFLFNKTVALVITLRILETI